MQRISLGCCLPWIEWGKDKYAVRDALLLEAGLEVRFSCRRQTVIGTEGWDRERRSGGSIFLKQRRQDNG